MMQADDLIHDDPEDAVDPQPGANPADDVSFATESEAVADSEETVIEDEAPLAQADEAHSSEEPIEEAEAAPEEPVVEGEASAPAPAEVETMADWLDSVEQAESEPGLRRGDIVEGEIIQTSPTAILIDVGAKAEGVISGRELERMDRHMLDDLQPGKKVFVYVLNPEDRNGNPVLSLLRAQEEQDWREAEQFADSQEAYEGKIAGYNRGGLIVRFGKVRGFVPASQISIERRRQSTGNTPEERWAGMIGEDILVKVVEVDRARNRLILSERLAMREQRARQKARLLEELQVGEVRTGRVISMTDFGVFVDLGGADGLVHLSELTWKPIAHPKELVKVGQTVKVRVISVDAARRRIGLSMKQLEDDPWERLTRTYQVGQLVQGTITKLTKFGAFARLVGAEEIEGLIHISEFADTRVAHPRDVVAVGDVLTLRVVKLDADQRRLGLSIKEVDSARYADFDWQLQQEALQADAPATPPTIGDVVEYHQADEGDEADEAEE